MSRIDETLASEVKARLKARFTEPRDIDTVLRSATGVRLFDEYATQFTPKNAIVDTLVDAMSDEGTLPLLLRQVYQRSPHRQDLRDWLTANFPGLGASVETAPDFSFQAGGKPVPPARSVLGGLQRYVRPELGDVDILPWLMLGLDAARRVCRIERNREVVLGTGFLVGPDLVLTNWHVVQDVVARNASNDLSCHFDYAAAPGGGIQTGEQVDVASRGILAWSPAAASEMPDHPGLPPLGPDTLDFALLKLDAPAGTARRWFDLTADTPALACGAPLLIVQHPAGAPLKLALDTKAVMAPFPPEWRLRYATNTDHGSSGSPVLTMNWRLCALHHLGDPRPGKPEFNEGIPIALVRDSLRAQGHGGLLSAP